MQYLRDIKKSKAIKMVGLALIAAGLVSFAGLTSADTTFNLTVNVSDVCGPVEAQVVVVNGPDDGAFGITTNGTYTFQGLNAGVFYLHISADGHQSQDTGTIVLTSNQTVNVTLERNDACPTTPPPPGPTPPPGPVPPPPPGSDRHNLTVNVSDVCGPVVAQIVIVNGPDDGAFGITNAQGQYTFENLNAGVFYLHITAENHAPKDTDAIVLTHSQTVNVTLDRTNGGCPPTENPRVTLVKNVINDDGGTAVASDFTLSIGGQQIRSGQSVTLAPGSYQASEVQRSGYTSQGWSGDCSSDGRITVALGDRKTCTITNNDDHVVTPPPPPPPAGNLTLAKDVRNLTSGGSNFSDSVSANPNDRVQFRIQVTAHNGAVNNVVVSDTLPGRLSYINDTLTVDGSGAGNNLSQVNLGNFTSGQTRTILLQATVAASSQFSIGTTVLTNTASATSSVNSPSDSASVSVTIAPPANNPPIGAFDAANCELIGGWAFDPNEPSKSVVVEIFANGPEGIGTKIFSGPTTGLRADVNQQYGITGLHGFTVTMPRSLIDGKTHEIWVYAQDTTTNQNTLFADRKIFDSAPCIPAQGTVEVIKLVRNVSQGQSNFSTSTNARPGEQVEYQIRVSALAGAVNNVVVADTMPGRLAYVASSLTVDGSPTSGTPANVSLGTVSASQTKVVAYRATVADSTQFSTGTTPLVNTVRVTSSSNSPSASATVNVQVDIVVPGNLNLVKLVRNVSQGQNAFATIVSAQPGETVEFQITASASGGNVNNVILSDTLPNRLNYVSGSLRVDNVAAGNSLSNINLGNLTSGQNKVVILRATVSEASQFGSGNTVLTNTANATSSSNSASSSASVAVNITPSTVVLSIAKHGRNVSQGQSNFSKSVNANPGDTVQFQLQVTNTGNTQAQNVQVFDTLPSNMTLASGSSTSFNLGTMNAGSSQTVNLSAVVAGENNFSCGSTTLTNVATAQANVSNFPSDSANVIVNRTNCGQTAVLSVVKEVRNLSTGNSFSGSTNAENGQTVQFRITIRNAGNISANNVRVTDFLPAGLVYVPGSFQIDSGTTSGTLFNGTQFLGTLQPGQSRVITFNATVQNNSTSSQTFVNTATASADNAPSASGQASVFAAGVAGGNINMVLSKRAFNQTQNADATTVVAKPGDVIVYTLTARNQGNATAASFVIEDNISDVLQLARLDDFSDGHFDMATLTLRWNPVNIPAGGTVEKTFRVLVNSSFPAGSDNVMTNFYGNTVNVTVLKPKVLGAFVAPKTGATTNVSLILATLTFASFLGFRKRDQLKEMFATFIR